MVKFVFDLVVACVLFLVLALPMVLISIVVRMTSVGPVLYWSDRVGQANKIFKMPKFRTMLLSTPALASHLLKDPDSHLSSVGGFLRRSSLDEIPQLFSVLKGDMSLVGPRPSLFNQYDLIALRNEKGVDKLRPGITGWAQVNGRDEVSIPKKVALDVEYMNRRSFWFDINILWSTLVKVVTKEGIKH